MDSRTGKIALGLGGPLVAGLSVFLLEKYFGQHQTICLRILFQKKIK